MKFLTPFEIIRNLDEIEMKNGNQDGNYIILRRDLASTRRK